MIYVHVPFCRSFCTYCDFYSEVVGGCREALLQRYTDDLCAEIRARRDEILAAAGVRTLYIGGGTPSVLPSECLRKIVEELRSAESCRGFSHWEEFTIEVNPEDIVERGPSYMEGLLALGVNRISMGVQSLDDGMLRWMNRRHSADGARKAWQILTSVRADLQKVPKMTVPPSENGGIPSKSAQNDGRLSCKDGEQHPDLAHGGPLREGGLSLSVDLISGVPGMSEKMLGQSLSEVLEWRPEHISVYQLSVEEGSALATMIARGQVAELPDEECRAQYDLLCRKLSAAGYHHYEISNWAQPGHEAVHNSAYWTRQPYVGLGPGAHSLEYQSPDGANAGAARQIRKWNSKRLTGWAEEGREVLTKEEIREETVMLAARTDHGPIPERDWFIADELISDLL